MPTALINTTDTKGGRRLHQIPHNTTTDTLLTILTWLDQANLTLGAAAADTLPEPSPKGLNAMPVSPEKFRSASDLEGVQALYQIRLGPHLQNEIFILQRVRNPDQWAVTLSAFFPDHGAQAQVS